MREPTTINLHEGDCARCGKHGMLGKGGCCLVCIAGAAKTIIRKMDHTKGILDMDADTATKLLADAKATEKQIQAQDTIIANLKEELKEAKDLRETLVGELRDLVSRDTPLLDAS